MSRRRYWLVLGGTGSLWGGTGSLVLGDGVPVYIEKVDIWSGVTIAEQRTNKEKELATQLLLASYSMASMASISNCFTPLFFFSIESDFYTWSQSKLSFLSPLYNTLASKLTTTSILSHIHGPLNYHMYIIKHCQRHNGPEG